MATWQFKIELVPRARVGAASNNVHTLYDSEGYDTSVAWEKYSPSIEVEPLMEAIFPKGESWHADLHTWGDEERSDIQIWYKNNRLESIAVRLDLREKYESLLSKVAYLASKLDCVVFIPESKSIIEPNVFALGKAATESNAAKFVKDPEGFLRSIGSGENAT